MWFDGFSLVELTHDQAGEWDVNTDVNRSAFHSPITGVPKCYSGTVAMVDPGYFTLNAPDSGIEIPVHIPEYDMALFRIPGCFYRFRFDLRLPQDSPADAEVPVHIYLTNHKGKSHNFYQDYKVKRDAEGEVAVSIDCDWV